jgi:hypothetical protein
MPRENLWILIVLRAWAEEEGPRIHLLVTDSDGGTADSVVASVNDAAQLVIDLLHGIAR